MVENDSLEYRMENINPILRVENMSRSLAFYVDIQGFTNAEWGDETFTSISRDDRGLYLCKGGQGERGTWVWMGFEGNIQNLYHELLKKDVSIKMPPTNFPWAFEIQIYDPDGHVLRFGTDPDESLPYVH